jgi:hypothetical protein
VSAATQECFLLHVVIGAINSLNGASFYYRYVSASDSLDIKVTRVPLSLMEQTSSVMKSTGYHAEKDKDGTVTSLTELA